MTSGRAIVVGEYHRSQISDRYAYDELKRLVKILENEKPSYLFVETTEQRILPGKDALVDAAREIGITVVPLGVTALLTPVDDYLEMSNNAITSLLEMSASEIVLMANRLEIKSRMLFGEVDFRGGFVIPPSEIIMGVRERLWVHVIAKSLRGGYHKEAVMQDYINSDSNESLEDFAVKRKQTDGNSTAVVVVGAKHIDARCSQFTSLLRKSGVEVETVNLVENWA